MTLYDLAYASAIGAAAPVWLALPRLRRKIFDALRQRDGSVPRGDFSRPAVLIHAVSMGEINATTALVRLLADADPDLRFILSTTSLTGQTRARQLYEKDPRITLVRYPFDFSQSVARLLDAQRPMVAVLMELEVWPNFTRECQRRGIPVLLINGRLSAYSYRGYRLLRPFIHGMFSRLTLACVQEEAYARRFARVGVDPDRIRVTGTMKFDTAVLADPMTDSLAVAQSVGLRHGEDKIWVCGSTGPGEEALILAAYAELRITFPALRLVIVPRHPDRFDEVATLIQSRGFGLIRRSTGGGSTQPALAGDVLLMPRSADVAHVSPAATGHSSTAVILGDTMGELRKFYALADIVFVGRSLVDLGSKQHGSDMIEPAALARPIIVGPFTANFAEAMNRFRQAGAVKEVSSGAQLQAAVAGLLLAPIAAAELAQNAQHVVRQNQGATARHVEAILEHLPRAIV